MGRRRRGGGRGPIERPAAEGAHRRRTQDPARRCPRAVQTTDAEPADRIAGADRRVQRSDAASVDRRRAATVRALSRRRPRSRARLAAATTLVELGVDEPDAPAAGHVRCQPSVEFRGRVPDWVAEIKRLQAGRRDHPLRRRHQRPRRAHDRTAQGVRPLRRSSRSRRRCHGTRRCWWPPAELTRGFRLPDASLQLYAEADVFEEERRAGSERRRSASKAFLSDLRDLKVGDLVVHVDHGIGVFVGLKQIGVGDTQQEFLELRYAGEDKLFVPVERLDLVQKYTGASRPPIDRLGGATWERAKTRVKKAMRDMAEELLKLYAAAQGGSRPRVQSRFALAAGVRGCVPVRADRRSEVGDRRHQDGPRVEHADGPPAVRRRRLRQDRSGDARRVQGGDGRQAGGGSRADDDSRLPAREDAARAFQRLPGHHRHGEPLPQQGRAEGDAREPRRRKARHHRRHASSAVEGRGCSAISGCSSWTRNSGSAWRTRRRSSSCGARWTCSR